MRHADRCVETLAELISALKTDQVPAELRWYRGHRSSAWSLTPSIARKLAHLDGELGAIKVFKQRARPLLSAIPQTEWEWIFLMQHYAAPTRLLDWSESPLTALYFALLDPHRESEAEDAHLWVLDPVALNVHAGYKHQLSQDLLAFDIDNQLEQYLPQNVNPKISRLLPVAGIGPQNSSRMAAQSGTFTVIHAEATPIDQVGDAKHIWRLVIPADAKIKLRQEMDLLRVGNLTFFPDLDRVAASVKEMMG